METLAILGGQPAVTLDYTKVATLPLCSQKAIDQVRILMEKGEISQSPIVQKFVDRFADYTGAAYVLCTNNGTAALDSALFAVGVRPGDEVIVPSYTFWASVTPILSQHAVPIFCEADPRTFCASPQDIESRITSRTKAIMVVHVWGNPCDLDGILAVARRHGIKVIEDCSHAHGATYHGQKVGTFGDVGCYSLQGSKTLPAGEGGILVTNTREYYERAVALGHYELIPNLPQDSPYRQYALTGMGHKYRVHPFAIALADAQLDELDARNVVRQKYALRFEQGIADLPVVQSQQVSPAAQRVYSYHYFMFDSESAGGLDTYVFLKALRAEGVACGYCGYGRLHHAPLFVQGGAYGDCKPSYPQEEQSLPVTEYLATHTFLGAPRFETECPQLVEQYVEAYHKVVGNLDALHDFAKTHDFSAEVAQLSGRSIAML
jgi:dTDP-4-amino-4,6-dideoxygalactose transaminase